MLSVYLKTISLLLSALSHNVGFTPPQPPSSEDDTVYKGQFFERVVLGLAYLSRMSITALSLINVTVILSIHRPQSYSPQILSNLCPGQTPELKMLTSFSLIFSMGFFMMILSCLLRLWCFSTLGPLFTYLVTVKPKHTLVTSGPYAYARHPSYTGVFFMFLGAAIASLSPGSYSIECGIMKTPTRWIVRLWLVCATYGIYSVYKRAKVEDELMQKTFADEWVEYRRTVPHKFIPGIL